MRFKGRMTEPGAMRDFMNVVIAIARMTKVCVIRLTPDSFNFNLANDRAPMVWATLEKDHFFVEYLVTGKSEDANEIYMEVCTAQLVKSVVSFKATAKSARIKLTSKQQTCLTFDIELSSLTRDSRLCVHDLPVTIIPQTKWKEYNEPQVEWFDISLEMPGFKHLRGVMDRLKNLSPTVEFSANTNGTLTFKAEADTASISVNFPKLTVFDYNEESDQQIVSASIDIKKFHSLLGWDIVHPTFMRCNILDERVVVISLHLENYLQINYYIPGLVT